MTTRHRHDTIAGDELVAAPAARACDDQSFELPTGIYVAMAVMFFGFIAVLNVTFSGHMGVTFGAIFFLVAAFFAIPIFMTRTATDSRTRALKWYEFLDRGVETENGRSSAGAATVLVLILPFLILVFGIAIATIAALN